MLDLNRVLSHSAFLVLAAQAALADPPKPTFEPRPPQDQVTLEVRGDDPAAPSPGRRIGAPGQTATVVVGGFFTVQANVDALGFNIPGDAGNEPSIAVDPTAPNRMAIGWRQFDSIGSDFRQGGYSSSVDGGRTWTEAQVLTPGLFRSDPVLGAGPDGTFYYLSLHVDDFNVFNTDMFISTDGGKTWPESHFSFGGDKQWFSVDSTGSKIYQAWNVAGNQFFPNQFNRALDMGQTWEDPVEYTPGGGASPTFGTTAVGPDDAVYVTGIQNPGFVDLAWVVRSDDAQDPEAEPSFFVGKIFLPNGGLFIPLVQGDGPNPGGLLGQLTVQTDHSGGELHGNVYMLAPVFGVFPSALGVDLAFFRSEDRGATWTEAIRVNDAALETVSVPWMGAMSVAPNGRIDVVYNDTRNNPEKNFEWSETYYTFSLDGGDTWSPAQVIAPLWNSFLGWPQQDKIGDYYDMVSDNIGAHLIYAATFNGEQDVYYVRIGDYDCNGNSVGDDDDLTNGDAADCNGNGIPDSCEIAAGAVDDDNGDGIPDECGLLGDLDGDGDVDANDLITLLGAWGACADCDDCPADLDGDCNVGSGDLILLLGNWG